MVLLLIGVALCTAVVILAATVGRRMSANSNSVKKALLISLDGQYVTIGIGARFVISQAGRLIVGDDPFYIILTNGKQRAVPLADIRWVITADGERVGGPW